MVQEAVFLEASEESDRMTLRTVRPQQEKISKSEESKEKVGQDGEETMERQEGTKGEVKRLSQDGETAEDEEEAQIEKGSETGKEEWYGLGICRQCGLFPLEEGEEEDEEQQEVRVKQAPKAPTQRERLEHEAVHLPYRSWCRHCIKGRGRNDPHRQSGGNTDEQETAVPRVMMDYFFLGDEEERAADHPMFVMVDDETGNRYARLVEMKGLGERGEMDWLVKDASSELKSWGIRAEKK